MEHHSVRLTQPSSELQTANKTNNSYEHQQQQRNKLTNDKSVNSHLGKQSDCQKSTAPRTPKDSSPQPTTTGTTKATETTTDCSTLEGTIETDGSLDTVGAVEGVSDDKVGSKCCRRTRGRRWTWLRRASRRHTRSCCRRRSTRCSNTRNG